MLARGAALLRDKSLMPQRRQISVSVVIPALNEQAGIASAVRHAWQAGADEVIVVDGGSVDATVSIAAQEQCRVVQTSRGRALQQNAGAAIATGDILLFLHADTWLSPDAANQLRAAASTGARAGAFRQRIAADGIAYRLLELGDDLRVAMRGVAYGDQGIFICRDLFQQVGGFPAVPLLEDLLLSRLVRRNVRLRLLPGPLFVDARRWKRSGVVRQTLRNWAILTAHALGVSPQRLAAYYRPEPLQGPES